jgi:hypothetical protein
VIAAGGSTRRKNKNLHAAAFAAYFRSSVTSSYKFSFTKADKKAQLLHTLDRQFEHATTTDEVML